MERIESPESNERADLENSLKNIANPQPVNKNPNPLDNSNMPTKIEEPTNFLTPENLENFNIQVPPKKSNLDYYKEYSKLYIYNFVLTAHAKELFKEQKSLMKKYQMLTQSDPTTVLNPSNLGQFKKKKRKRRRKDEVQRDFRCIVEGCNKAYGSENSRNQHLKLKHPEVWEHISKGKSIESINKSRSGNED